MVALSEVAKFINGAAFKPVDWTGIGKKIVRIQNLNNSSKPYNRTERIVDKKYEVNMGDILVSWSASLGVFIWQDEEQALLNQHIFKVVPNEEVVCRKYLLHALHKALEDMGQHLHGATMKHVNRGEFLATQIYLPPLKEQKRIAAILDKADAIRRKRQQAIDLTDQLLRSVFLDMFGDPVTNPKGIKIAPMTEVFNITTGKLNSNAGVVGGEYPFFTCAKIAFEIDTHAFDQEALLLAGNNAQAKYDVKHYIGKFNAYQRTYVLTLKDERWSYLFYQFALEYQLENLKRFSKGSNTKYITMEIMSRTMLPLPHPNEQLEFVRRVEIARSLKRTYAKYNELAVANFQSLTQQAFNGQLSKQTKAA